MVDVNLRDKTVIHMEETFLDAFRENCDLLSIEYRVAIDGSIRLMPELNGKAIVLNLLTNTEAARELAVSIKENLVSHGAICIISKKIKYGHSLRFLDAQIAISITEKKKPLPDHSTLKFFLYPTYSTRVTNIISSIIKQLVGLELEFDYSVASWWDRFLNVKFWPLQYQVSPPTIIIESDNWELLQANQVDLSNIIASSIIEHCKNNFSQDDLRVITDLANDIYANIKASSGIIKDNLQEDNVNIIQNVKMENAKSISPQENKIQEKERVEEKEDKEKGKQEEVNEQENGDILGPNHEQEKTVPRTECEELVAGDEGSKIYFHDQGEDNSSAPEKVEKDGLKLPKNFFEQKADLEKSDKSNQQAAPVKRFPKPARSRKVQYIYNHDPLKVPGEKQVFQFSHPRSQNQSAAQNVLPPKLKNKLEISKSTFRASNFEKLYTEKTPNQEKID